jgi:heme A synthase
MSKNKFANFAWFVLIFNLGVILWGAYVRATGSGAGCGAHWPLCNGEVLPRAARVETIIEFTHRVTSGLAFLFVLVMLLISWRIYPKGHHVRLGTKFSMIFIITEALVGAGLVLFEWVADDVSLGRVISISVHLINTFLLIAFLSLTAWWASGGSTVQSLRRGAVTIVLLFGFIGLVFVGVSGAITALGDTIFPADSLSEGIQQDFSTTSHFLIRLRVWHPLLAITVGMYLAISAGLIIAFVDNFSSQRLGWILISVVILQLLAGVVNLLLLAPVWMQLIHLLLADLVWITMVLLTAVVHAGERPSDKILRYA